MDKNHFSHELFFQAVANKYSLYFSDLLKKVSVNFSQAELEDIDPDGDYLRSTCKRTWNQRGEQQDNGFVLERCKIGGFSSGEFPSGG